MKYYILILLVCLTFGLLRAQDERILKRIVPPSPEVTALGKVVSTPVSLYTGIPSITVPIFTVTTAEINLPISLDYHAGGIRVDEIASCVGLGWSLNAGGVISSKVVGLQDFANDEPNYMTLRNDYDFFNNLADYQWAKRVAAGELDTEPDNIFYNFCGRGGNLAVVGKTNGIRNYITIPYEPLKIENNGRRIVDEKGVKYVFGEVETVEVSMPDNYVEQPYDGETRKLTRIESPTGHWIDLEYITSSYQYVQGRVQSDFHVLLNQFATYTVGFDDLAPFDKIATSTVSGACYLKKIIADNGTVVEFIYDSSVARRDLPSAKKLTQIDIYSNNNLIKTYNLQQSYFGPEGSYSQSLPADNFRLKLDKVIESGKPPYEFTYNANGTNKYLPARSSFAQDSWGYYNGKNDNTKLLPQFYTVDGQNINGADREPNAVFMQYGILNVIKYPTGATSTFFYKANEYTLPAGRLTGNKILTSQYAGNNSAGTDPPTVFSVPANAQDIKFTVTSTCPTESGGGASIFLRAANNLDMYVVRFLNGVQTQIINLDTAPALGGSLAGKSFLVDFILECESCCPNGYFAGVLSWNILEDEVTTVPTNITVGGLRIEKIVTSSKGDGSDNMTRVYKYDNPETGLSSSGITPKIRPTFTQRYFKRKLVTYPQPAYFNSEYVKRVSSSVTPLGAFKGSNICYEFVSELEGENGENGKIQSKFTYYNDLTTNESIPNVPYTDYDFLRGLLIERKIFKKNYATGGFTLRELQENQYQINHNPINFWAYKDGETFNEKNILGMRLHQLLAELDETQAIGPNSPSTHYFARAEYLYSFYKKVRAWYYLKQTDDYTYYSDNLDFFTKKTTQYFYDNPLHAQITRSVTYGSDQTVLTNRISYPQDYLAGTTFIDNLVDNNLISFPIEQVSYSTKGSDVNILHGTIYRYFNGGKGFLEREQKINLSNPLPLAQFKFSNNNLGVFPDNNSLKSFVSDSRYIDKISYLYDTDGNPVEIKKVDGPTTTLLWGHKGRYPIIKIENASYSEVSAILGQTLISSLYAVNVSESAINIAASILRNHAILTKAKITSYTYSPLVGMTSMTDTRGIKETYEYDGFHRLKSVLDFDSNILKNYQYNYKP